MGLKIAVYSICKDEAKNAKRYMDSTRGADGVFLLDTGSVNDTVKLLKAAGANVEVGGPTWDDWLPRSRDFARGRGMPPWRFDIARNKALELIPKDFDACVIADLDDVLAPGWREALEARLECGATRIQARYTFSWKPDGSPNEVYYMDRAHARHGYRWVGPCHECLEYIGKQPEKSVPSDKFQVWHKSDWARSRKQYLPLLEVAAFENPEGDRWSHYLGREYFYAGRHTDAIKELTRHLTLKRSLGPWEFAASMRMIAYCHDKMGNRAEAEKWFLRSVSGVA